MVTTQRKGQNMIVILFALIIEMLLQGWKFIQSINKWISDTLTHKLKKGWKTIQTLLSARKFTNLLSARKYYKGWKAVLVYGKKGTKKENTRTEIYLSPEGKRFTKLMSARKHYVEELQNHTTKSQNKEAKNENKTDTLDIPDKIKKSKKKSLENRNPAIY